ncbi:YmdB family metallophosphoesterase [Patescibacteria group bacterium]
MTKFLIIGDINGKIGRRAVTKILPEWKKKYQPDYTIANAENIAHGTGVTRKTLDEVQAAGIDLFTSGNHVWSKPEANEILEDEDSVLLRPHNYPIGTVGRGIKVANIGGKNVLVVNLQGQVFMEEAVNNPFKSFDDIYDQYHDQVDAILVDLHCEATSEKVAFGWHVVGRAQAMWGTHTHIQTADERIIRNMAYITDIGMVGDRDSVIGVNKEVIIDNFINQTKGHHEIAEKGWAIAEGIVVTIDLDKGQAKNIERVRSEIEVK